jgi:hypothetical protein
MAFFPGFPSVPPLCCSFRHQFRRFGWLTGSLPPALHTLSFEDTTQGSFQLVAHRVGISRYSFSLLQSGKERRVEASRRLTTGGETLACGGLKPFLCHNYPSGDPTPLPKDSRQLNRYFIGISPKQGFYINPALLAAHAPDTAA